MSEVRLSEPTDPYILLAQEYMRDVLVEICSPKSSGILVINRILNHSNTEVEELLNDIGFGEYLNIPEVSPNPDETRALPPEVSARYRRRPMIVSDLVGDKKAVKIPGEQSWSGELNIVFPFTGSLGAGSAFVLEHAVTLTGYSSDTEPFASSTLKIQAQVGRDFTKSTVHIGEPRPLDFDTSAAFCALAWSLHDENVGA